MEFLLATFRRFHGIDPDRHRNASTGLGDHTLLLGRRQDNREHWPTGQDLNESMHSLHPLCPIHE
jgi:hypothetical protein